MCAAEKSSQSSDPIHRLISVVQSHACRCYPASSAPWNVYKHLRQRGAGPVHNFVKSQLDHHWLSATAENRPAFPRLWARVCVSVTPSSCACVYPGCVWVLHTPSLCACVDGTGGDSPFSVSSCMLLVKLKFCCCVYKICETCRQPRVSGKYYVSTKSKLSSYVCCS